MLFFIKVALVVVSLYSNEILTKIEVVFTAMTKIEVEESLSWGLVGGPAPSSSFSFALWLLLLPFNPKYGLSFHY